MEIDTGCSQSLFLREKEFLKLPSAILSRGGLTQNLHTYSDGITVLRG